MKAEEIFGDNAGKVWRVLNENGELPVSKISKLTSLKSTDVHGALGWLGREGKVEPVKIKKGVAFRLLQ